MRASFYSIRLMKQIQVILSVLTLSLISLSLAQASPYVLKTFDLTQLDARPGQILVSPGALTLLEFDDQIEDVSTARPDAMTIEVTGSVIRLRSNWKAGSTDLVVTIANRTAMFTVEIDPEGETPRRYVVERPKPPTAVSSRSERSSSPIAPELLEKLDSSGAVFPDWLEVSFNVLSVPGDEVVIQYGIKNSGTNDIANDPLRLKVLQEGYSTPFKLERLSTGGTVNRIKPGFSEYGTILVEDPLPGKLTLLWDFIEIGPGLTHILRKDVYDGLVKQVE